MTQKYIIAKARCEETRETVKSQNLTRRYKVWERTECQIEADYLAQQLQRRTGRTWRGFVEEYSLEGDVNKL